MARGDDLIKLIIALADMVGSVAKNMKKILAIIRKGYPAVVFKLLFLYRIAGCKIAYLCAYA